MMELLTKIAMVQELTDMMRTTTTMVESINSSGHVTLTATEFRITSMMMTTMTVCQIFKIATHTMHLCLLLWVTPAN